MRRRKRKGRNPEYLAEEGLTGEDVEAVNKFILGAVGPMKIGSMTGVLKSLGTKNLVNMARAANKAAMPSAADVLKQAERITANAFDQIRRGTKAVHAAEDIVDAKRWKGVQASHNTLIAAEDIARGAKAKQAAKFKPLKDALQPKGYRPVSNAHYADPDDISRSVYEETPYGPRSWENPNTPQPPRAKPQLGPLNPNEGFSKN